MLLMGWDYSTFNADMRRILANAVQTLGGLGGGAFKLYDVYFGASNPPTTLLASNSLLPQCSPGPLAFATKYYWRVVARNAAGEVAGPVWSFKTQDMPPPLIPSNPVPANDATSLPVRPILTWDAGGAVPATFSIILYRQDPPIAEAAANLTEARYVPASALQPNTTYYWRVIAHNPSGDTPGPIWHFTTQAPPPQPVLFSPTDAMINVRVNPLLLWNQPSASPVRSAQAPRRGGAGAGLQRPQQQQSPKVYIKTHWRRCASRAAT